MISILLSITLLFSTPLIPKTKIKSDSSIVQTKTPEEPLISIKHKGFMERHDTSLTIGAFAFVPVFAALTGMQMWEWGDSTHFKANSDGWFERTQTHGGADKTGHMMFFYLMAKVSGAYFDLIYPEDPWKAALYGGALSALGGIAVEIGDGFATDFGFSWPDLVFDGIGIAIALAQARWPWFDDLIDLSGSGFLSHNFLGPYNENKTDLFTDYSGQMFTINIRMGGIPVIKETPLRYFRLDVGYFTRCYQPYDDCSFERTATHNWETRNIFLGVSFDLAKMIEDHSDGGRFVNGVKATSRIINILGTVPLGLNFDLNHGGKIGFGTSVPTP
jgi:Predicted periplasmic lipoprotein (DUF2279)